MKFRYSLSIVILMGCASADIYMQNPRGSNNKLNEQQNNVQNNRRLFDSQNNDDGGYQVGDACVPNCLDETTNQYQRDKPGAGEGVMQFYEGSELPVQWSNQHGCGANPYLHCQVILQYACEDHEYFKGLRDGKTTERVPENDPDNPVYGTHESKAYWDLCSRRERNRGLYTSTQNFNNDRNFAINTRQDTNNNGDRYGWECPEERDYYPYWHPTGWRDIWIGTDETFRCSYYQSESENVKKRGLCSNPFYNNIYACQQNQFEWKWYDAHNIPAPECGLAPFTRHNHNGNSDTGDHPTYLWKIPFNRHTNNTKCILRIRYNISTYDFDGWSTFSDKNGENSPVKQNPSRDWLNLGLNYSGPLRLAINTDQFPRTFEDRSHVFKIMKLPPGATGWLGNNRIINLNVRGRRGNIVQVYPAVEYDFVPTTVKASRGDYLHIQWVGSDANAQGNAGQGRTGTDRNNLVLVPSVGRNIPSNLNPPEPQIPPLHFTNDRDKIAFMAYLNQTNCDPNTQNTQDPTHCRLLNGAPATVNVGLVRVDNIGKFSIMSTRNNQFTNREQKATIIISEDWATVGGASAIGIGGLGFSVALVFFGIGYAKRHPDSAIGKLTGAKSSQPLVSREFDDEESEVEAHDEAEVSTKKTWSERYAFIAKINEWYEWEASRIRFLSLFGVAIVAVWLFGFISNLNKNPAPYFQYAKGFGKMLDLCISFILLPVLRNFLSFVRTTPAAGVLPLDDNILIHKITAYLIAFASIGHITFHYMDFVWAENYRGQSIAIQALGTVPGLTGHIVLLLMMIMFSTAMIKRNVRMIFGRRFDGYRLFIQTHKLWMPVFALLWIHSANFWTYSLWPLCFMALEKVIQSRRARLDVTIVEARLVGKDILSLKMRLLRKGKKFRYKAGQYLFLNCVDVSETEWHPFTITSAPEEAHFSCHIRCRQDMDWTFRLRQRLGFAERTDATGNPIPVRTTPLTEAEHDLIPRLKVDGPYGSASEEVFDHNVSVLVGAGIGVTPFISILKSISIRMKLKTEAENDKVTLYFYWICRDQQEFDSFKDLFEELMEIPQLASCLEVNTYTTGELNLKKLKMEKYNQFSGKPNWNRIFKEKAQKHTGETIGVFLCGPNAIAAELNMACKKNSDKPNRHSAIEGSEVSRTVFKFHKENF